METKWCNRCKKTLPTENFNKGRGGKPSSYCTKCQREYCKNHYSKNKEAHKKRRAQNNRKRRAYLRKLINEAKNVPCTDCGERHPSWAMDFDHRDPKLKKFNLGDAARAGIKEQKILDEIKKCDIVCALCHRYRTYGERREKDLDSSPEI